MARGQWRIIVGEVPHGVSGGAGDGGYRVGDQPQPRAGKKDITPGSEEFKAAVLAVLDVARDESSDVETVRLILEPRSSRIAVTDFMACCWPTLRWKPRRRSTDDDRPRRHPQQKNLRQILSEWVDFRFVTVERRSRFRLDEVERRIHILDGRMIVFLRIEEVIRVIREADEPKPSLMEKSACRPSRPKTSWKSACASSHASKASGSRRNSPS